MTEKGLQLRSLMKSSGELEVSLAEVDIPKPGPNEVLIRLGASPVNPSDLGMLFGPADLSTIKGSGTKDRPVLTAQLPPGAQKALANRVDKSMPVGSEGAGVVIDAGSSPAAQALKGKTVAALGGAMYAQYRVVHVDGTLELPAGATDAQGASSFVNPLTVLGMVETLHREGHKALAHTAAASQLGQMLVRVCQADGIELVNIVRKEEQVKLLKDLGAKHIVDSSRPSFSQDLEDAFAKAGVTLAFDATGGGKLPNQLLSAMERALTRDTKEFSRYGSDTHKQVYLYGGLDTAPTELLRNYGMAWGVGGWLVMSCMSKIGKEAAGKLKERVGRELTTTFATQYAKELTLQQLLDPEEVKTYAQRTTGGKVLVRP